MKKWVVRFLSLLVFNIVVLLVIGWLSPARVGWAAVWAGVVLTAVVIWIKPLVTRWFASMAARSAVRRTRAGEKVVEFLLALAVAFVVWVATVLLTGVTVGGGILGVFWGWVIPPIILLWDGRSGTRSTTASRPAPAPSTTARPGRGRRRMPQRRRR